MTERNNRKIVLHDFYGERRDVYEDELCWHIESRIEASSLFPGKIFRFEVEELGLNHASFYYLLDDDTFYGIHREQYPIECKIVPRDRNRSKYIGFQCDGDTHEGGKVIAPFDVEHDIWNNLKIGGRGLEDVLRCSCIIGQY